MKLYRTIGVALIAAMGLTLGGVSLAGDDDVTMQGSFVWERRDGGIPGDLKAVFTPAGEGAWDVVFYFDWEDEPREWQGSAKGSLTSGSLEGEALEERDRKRTFVFSGTVADGIFKGDHGSMRDGEMKKSGTLEWKAL